MSDAKGDNLLIVDDEEINRAILANIFSSEYTILEAEDGQAGLDAICANTNTLSAILLDVVMPRLNGIEVLRRLHQVGLTERIPVFLITADVGSETMREAYALGVMDVILKPVVPYVVRRRVNSVVELFRARHSRYHPRMAILRNLQNPMDFATDDPFCFAVDLNELAGLTVELLGDLFNGSEVQAKYLVPQYIHLNP